MFLDIYLLFLSLVATFGIIELVVYVLRLRVENQALRNEGDNLNSALKYMEDMHRLFTELFRMCFTVLDLGQHILEKLFPDGGSCISMHGPVLRKMFEYVLHSDLPFNFLLSGFCFAFKVHSSFTDFQIFCRAFARYIYANQMRLPGTSFIVTAIEPVRGEAKFRSRNNIRVYTSYVFVVRFNDKNSKTSYVLKFECDAGNWCPEEDFDVNVLEFHATRGLSAMLNGRPLPVLSVVRAICEKSAQWNIIPDAHFSSLRNLISMMSDMYSLHGCPCIVETDTCPFSLDSSKFALEFSGCACAPHDRRISVAMLCQRLESDPLSSLICPYCKRAFPLLTHEPNRRQKGFDLSCIDEELSAEEIKILQSEAQASVLEMKFEPTDMTLLLEQLSDIGKAPFPRRYRIRRDQPHLLLFFGGESQDGSDDDDDADADDDDVADDVADDDADADDGYYDDSDDDGYYDDSDDDSSNYGDNRWDSDSD
jgi:hypothetical protein